MSENKDYSATYNMGQEILRLEAKVKELESQLEQAKKDISQVAKHYEEGTIFDERNYESFYTDSFQDFMCEIYKRHNAAMQEGK